MRPVTSQDVAREAGVSRATVSYVLNRVEGARVSEATRARVVDAAERLGYVPHAAAAALRGGRTSLVLVGLPAWPLGPPIAAAIARLVEGLAARGYTPLVHVDHPEADDGLVRACERARPVGVIALGEALPPGRADELRRLGARAVIGAASREGGPPALVFDQCEVGSVALAHLAGRGHRHVAALMPDAEGVAGLVAERVEGAMAAAAEAGVELEVVRAGEPGSVAAALLPHVRDAGPTALYAFNDEYAMAALAALADAGAGVPGRMAVIGTDDSPAARLTRPQLTTIRLVADAHWAELAAQLHAMIEGAEGAAVVAHPGVVPGGTT